MILANAVGRLSNADLNLAATLLAGEDRRQLGDYSLLISSGGWIPMLDHPDLFDRLVACKSIEKPSAVLFTYVAVRNSMLGIGLTSTPLSDYLTALLLGFGNLVGPGADSERLNPSYNYLVDIVADMPGPRTDEGFTLRVYLGNYSLWLAGLFPDFVSWRTQRKGAPGFGYYDELGSRGFLVAAEHPVASTYDLTEIYAELAASFSKVRVALNRLSDRVFFRNYSSPDRLMREVADEARFPRVTPLQ